MTSARSQSGFARRFAPPLFLAYLLVSPLAFADQVVYFVNGKAMMVKSVEKGDRITTLEMEGGGRIGVPTEQIARIEEYQVSGPSAVAAPPVEAVAPNPTLPVRQPPIAAAAPPLTQVPAGPGIGGAQLPGQDFARIRPLNLGGAEGRPRANVPQRPGVGNAGPGMGGPGRAPAPTLVGAGPEGPNRRGGRAAAFRRGGRGGRPGPEQAAQPQQPPASPQNDPNPPVTEENDDSADGTNGATDNNPPVEVATPSDPNQPEEE
jgi:hypothetical protein